MIINMVLKYPTFFQHFAPEKLDAELDFTNIQHFIQVFCPKMLDVELEIAVRCFSRPEKEYYGGEMCSLVCGNHARLSPKYK